MEKKYQIIYIWSFIIISGIVLLLLYTPLGGDIHYAAYNEQNRYAVSPGVNYSSQIGSLSSGGSGSNSSYGYYSAPSQYSSPTYQSITSVNSSTINSNNSNNKYTSSGITTRSSKTKTGAGGSGSASGVLGMSKNKKAEGNNTINDDGALGGTVLNSTSNNTGVIQRASAEEGDPLDPGGDPVTDPLPIGNELGVLLCFALAFSVYKKLFKR